MLAAQLKQLLDAEPEGAGEALDIVDGLDRALVHGLGRVGVAQAAALKEQADELVPVLVREAGRTFPGTLSAVDGWMPPWEAAPTGRVAAPTGGGGAAIRVRELLARHPHAALAILEAIG